METFDLGHGVRVSGRPAGGWQVASARIRLPWTVRTGGLVGSAVLWRDEAYEVVEAVAGDEATSWTLEPWSEGEAMRGVFRLDRAWIGSLADAERTGSRAVRLWWWTLAVAPLLALAPAAVQRRWRAAWGFPAVGATATSGVLELAVGAVGLIQAMTMAFQGPWFLPGPLRPLVAIGPLMAVEGLIRLLSALGHGEPMGSLVGLPLAALQRHPPSQSGVRGPEIRILDEPCGVLELTSETYRADWTADGVLNYRDRAWRMRSVERVGGRWRYRFEPADGDGDGPTLRLLPPPPGSPAVVQPESPTLLAIALASTLACLAPRVYQERWARHLGVRPIWFTLLGAGAELVGGWVNLGRATSGGEWLQLAVNLFFLVEAVARLALLVSRGRPVGSLLGIPLRPLLERLIPGEE